MFFCDKIISYIAYKTATIPTASTSTSLLTYWGKGLGRRETVFDQGTL